MASWSFAFAPLVQSYLKHRCLVSVSEYHFYWSSRGSDVCFNGQKCDNTHVKIPIWHVDWAIIWSLKLPVTDGSRLMGAITEAVVEWWETDELLVLRVRRSLSLNLERMGGKKASHIEMEAVGGRTCVVDWLK